MFNKLYYLTCFALLSQFIYSQKINTDSLLVVTNNAFAKENDYTKTIKLAQLGIKEAPNYLDFHVVLGRAYHKINVIDSARFYYNHVIKTNPKYKETFLYLSKLETEQKNYESAIEVIDNGITIYPDEKDFYKQKYNVLKPQKNNKKTIAFLEEMEQKFPDEPFFKNVLENIKNETELDQIGLNYSYTHFNRTNYGPWHYSSIQYLRQREKITLIGRINFTDRRVNGNSANSGYLYEFETYFKNYEKSYSYFNIGFGNESVFPKFIISYSYFQDLGKGWEGELGFRYNKREIQEIKSAVIGIGKYFGSNWINARTYVLAFENKTYPSLALTYRYYFTTKYDYLSVLAGYGTSPDERLTLTQFDQRVALNSQRIGIGYNKLYQSKYFFGILASYNNQEYFPMKFQNEITVSLTLNYKL